MKNKRRKTLAWFYALLESSGATYDAGAHEGHVIVHAANGRSMTLSAFDLETLSRSAIAKRFERLCAGDPTREQYPFVAAEIA